MKKTILITRPKDQSQEIKQYLEANGFEVFIEPIFSVQMLPLENKILQSFSKEKVAALVVTSGNAVQTAIQAIEKLQLGTKIRIFVVGKRTAQKFISLGYDNVSYSDENSAHGLRDLILQDHITKNGVLLYFCGEIITLDFKVEFAKYGIKLEKIMSYKIVQSSNFSAAFLERVQASQFDFTLTYSKNSARHFLGLLKKHNLFEYYKSSQIVCLSAKILAFVRDCGFKNCVTFDEISILNKFYE